MTGSTLERLALWLADNVFLPGRLSTILVLVGLAIFIGLIPSPLLDSTAALRADHASLREDNIEIQHLLRQICGNTAKSQQEINACFFMEKRVP
jgi:hypothetical protein